MQQRGRNQRRDKCTLRVAVDGFHALVEEGSIHDIHAQRHRRKKIGPQQQDEDPDGMPQAVKAIKTVNGGLEQCGFVRVLPAPLELESYAILAEPRDAAQQGPRATTPAGAHCTVCQLSIVLSKSSVGIDSVSNVKVAFAFRVQTRQ